jgi:hypothetical protein
MSTKETSSANAELRAWYLRRLRPRLALAARERGISTWQAAAFGDDARPTRAARSGCGHVRSRTATREAAQCRFPAARPVVGIRLSPEAEGVEEQCGWKH